MKISIQQHGHIMLLFEPVPKKCKKNLIFVQGRFETPLKRRKCTRIGVLKSTLATLLTFQKFVKFADISCSCEDIDFKVESRLFTKFIDFRKTMDRVACVGHTGRENLNVMSFITNILLDRYITISFQIMPISYISIF